MSEVDLVEAARGAVFMALEAGHAGTGAAVHDPAKQDAPAPFVMLGDIAWVNEGSKREPLLRISIDVVTTYRGADRAELRALMHANELALDEADLTAAGVVLQQLELVSGAMSGRGPDGATFAGLQTFEIYAEPA